MANLNIEISRLADSARAVAESLRLRAAAIDEVANGITLSNDPADAAKVVELVQSAFANSNVDLLLQQAIRAARAERE